MSDTLQRNTIVCEEVFDENSLPSEDEVVDYAKTIGIDPKCEPHLLPIALKGLMQPLPKGWKPCYDASIDRWYYFNKVTRISQWEHPVDSIYRNIVKRGRSEGYSSAAEDDSKGTAKEDLKSFEEVSDLLSSNTDKPEPPEDTMFLDKGRPKSHQPLLLRRKQLQSGGEQPPMSSFQVAKLMNSTMRENSFLNLSDVGDVSSSQPAPPESIPGDLSGVGPKLLQPLQRSRTLDPIPTFTSNVRPDAPPIKGILRESSFSGLPNRNLAKPNSLTGELSGSNNDLEDDKKRSVRFADTERKSLDIKFQFSDDSEGSYSGDDGGGSGSSSDGEDHQSDDNLNGTIKEPKRTKTKFDISANNLERVNQQINAINVSKMKEKFFNSQAALEMTSLGNSEDDTDDSNNHKPRSPSKMTPSSREEKTGRFLVSKTILDNDCAPKDSPLHRDDSIESLPAEDVPVKIEPVSIAAKKEEADLDADEVDGIAKRKTAERMAQLEERITREIQEKIGILKQQQNEILTSMTEELNSKHEAEKARIMEEHNVKLQDLKQSLEKELNEAESKSRAQHQEELSALVEKLSSERAEMISAAEAHHQLLLSSARDAAASNFESEKLKIESEYETMIQEHRDKVMAEIANLQADEASKLEEMKIEQEKTLEQMKQRYASAALEEEAKFKREEAKVEAEFIAKVNALKDESDAAIRRITTKNNDEITTTNLQHKATMDSLIAEHDRSMSAIKIQFQKEEDELKRVHSEQIEAWNSRLKKLIDKEPNSLSVNRDFEKMRCEKRLLEDKYRSLKDKYVQLKTDMKIAVERKLQSRARRKKDVFGYEKEEDEKLGGEQKTRNDKNKNNNSAETDAGADEKFRNRNPRINIEQINLKDPHKEGAENDPSSDDQYTSLSLTLPTDDQRSLSISPVKTEPDLKRKYSSRGRFRIEYLKDGQGNVLDEVRSQLKELEEIEEQIPANSQGDTYLRYPFHGPGLSTSAEVDFYRHRVIVEQEAVRTARECLLQQKRELEARQTLLRTNNNSSNMQQLQQQERDLTEMEVSLHRTRALLGEKMIRLRLLGQTLNRLVDDSPSPTNNPGSLKIEQALSPGAYPADTASNYVLHNLDNINSEIREIRSQLSKRCVGGAVSDDGYPRPPKPVRPHRRMPSNKAELEARLQGLRDWLDKPPSNIDWNQLTL